MTVWSDQIHRRVTGLFILMPLILSACVPIISENPKLVSENPKPLYQEKPVQVASHCSALEYYEALTVMTGDELKLEESILRENLGQDESICYHLQLVMLLALPEAGAKEDEEAEQILMGILDTLVYLAPQDRQAMQLLSDQTRWRRKIRSNQQVLKEELRKQLEKQLKIERAVSLKLKNQLVDAQSKLKQLKEIDRNINEQEQKISTPSTDKIPNETK